MSTSDASSPPYTFTQIIDADHLTIQSLAAKTRRILSTIHDADADTTNLISSLLPILHEITWRLIRHDLSESLVMRPAFIATLPAPQGQEMADHDARDHANGRILLLGILNRLADPATLNLTEMSEQVIRAFDDLGKHMEIESGEFLPYFEGLIDGDTSKRLAKEYTESLCMTPYLQVPVDEGGLKQVFEDVVAYVRMDPVELKRKYEDLVLRGEVNERLCEAMKAETEKELARLQVWKWRSLTASDSASKENSEPQSGNCRSNKL